MIQSHIFTLPLILLAFCLLCGCNNTPQDILWHLLIRKLPHFILSLNLYISLSFRFFIYSLWVGHKNRLYLNKETYILVEYTFWNAKVIGWILESMSAWLSSKLSKATWPISMTEEKCFMLPVEHLSPHHYPTTIEKILEERNPSI